MLLRFDDTNPSKEKNEFVEAIVEDLATLGLQHSGDITHSSDYFEQMMELCSKMIKSGKAYVDKTPVDEMRKQRMDGIESSYRNAAVEENLRLWNEMIKGSDEVCWGEWAIEMGLCVRVCGTNSRHGVLITFGFDIGISVCCEGEN